MYSCPVQMAGLDVIPWYMDEVVCVINNRQTHIPEQLTASLSIGATERNQYYMNTPPLIPATRVCSCTT